MKPVLQALVLAERVYDLNDGRKVICGTFTGIVLTRFPVAEEANQKPDLPRTLRGGAGSPYAYISLTAVCDGTRLQLQFASLKRNRVLFQQEIVIRSNDRLATIELVSALPHIHVTESGAYAFEVVCEGEILGSYRVDVDIRDDGAEAGDTTSEQVI